MNALSKRRTLAGLAAFAVGVVGLPMLPSPTAEATFPGENGLIAFSRNSDVWVMNPDGTDPVILTTDFGTVLARPSWSPDGTQIAFDESDGDGDLDVWVMNADGTDPVNLTDDPDLNQADASWSPDGTQIAFTVFSGGDSDVWVMNADGTNPVNITNDPEIDQARPAWSPDGAQIAFDAAVGGFSDVWVMNADGTDPANLTKDSARQIAPSWSPDGTQIAFETLDVPNGDVWVMDADGTDLVNLTNDPDGDQGDASWSPDGTQIAFHADSPFGIHVMDADGGNTHTISAAGRTPDWQALQPPEPVATSVTLTADPAEPVEGDDVTLTATVEADGEADAEPTGTVEFFDGDDSLGTAELASQATLTVSDLVAGEHDITAGYSGDDTFAAAASDPLAVTIAEQEPTDPPGENGLIAFSRDGDVWTMNPDGTDAVNLTDDPDAIQVSPAWSPDGTKIAFNAFAGDDSDVWVMNADGTNPVNLTDDPDAGQVRPSWSPDGTQIAFDALSGDGFDVWVMNADGTDPVNLTNDPDADQVAPAWSPDGTQIAFDTFAGDDVDVWAMNVDGTDPVNLTNDPDTDQGDASWSPDGTQIAFATVEFPGDVWAMNADGTDPVNLTNDPDTDQNSPSWSPDGTQIAIAAAAADESFEIHVMDADGGNARSLGAGTEPDWTPLHPPEPVATTVTFTSDPAEPVEGDDVTLTATVEADGEADAEPTGTVEFFDGDDSLGTADLGSPATFTVSDLAAGEHDITAHYSGDDTFAAAISDSVTVTIAEPEPDDAAGSLPDTGMNVAGLAGLGAMLAAGGLGLLLARRRRTARSS